MTCPYCKEMRIRAETAEEALRQSKRDFSSLASSISAVANLTPAQGKLVAVLFSSKEVASFDYIESKIDRNRNWVTVVAFKIRMRAPWIGLIPVGGIGLSLAESSREELRKRLSLSLGRKESA